MDFKPILNESKKIALEAAAAIKQQCKTLHQKSLQQQAQMQAVNQQQYLTQKLFDIQFELFCVMQGGHYSFLPPIYEPKNIRIHSYQFAGQTPVFCYTIPVNTMPARTILDRLKDNLNTDIYQYQQALIYDCGYNNAMFNHPYIVSGLYVTDIQPLATDIIIKVVTNC